MPKGNPYVIQQANINASRKLLNQSRNAEFKYSQDVLGGIYGNLKTNIGGVGAALTKDQDRQLGALQRLAANQKAASGRITKGAARSVGASYGGVIGSAMAPQIKSIAAKGKAGGQVVGGQKAAGNILATGNEAAQKTLGQGVALAKEGAAFELADALRYRAKNDASLIAQEQMSLDQMRLQNQLDIENYKKKLAIQEAHANGGSAGLSAVATAGANAASGLYDQYNTLYKTDANGQLVALSDTEKQGTVHNEDGTYTMADGTVVRTMNAGEAAANYVATNGIQDPNQIAVINALSTAMYQAGAGSGKGTYSATPETLQTAVSQQLALLYPNLYQKHAKDINGLLASSLNGVTADTSVWDIQGATGLQAGIATAFRSGQLGAQAAFDQLRKTGMPQDEILKLLRSK